ncbi:hypothetical protein GGQ88_001702 [Novosphingobium hassiacum]|uniref:Uncharacterized protein n=1 Tax=Novosphingobium hassiacum TaxID=173676 RepID=A0A7W5ZUX1_9SPHN|nr:hypothetical protein [Novosphingobium hassiacum]MBB3860436.1 hypothetical protein [Novosphingobium hassiacum]
MSNARTIAEARALRDEALVIFRADLDLAKTESSPARIKERAVDEAVELVDAARDIAKDNMAVIGATSAALVAWFFRDQLLALAEKLRDAVKSGD